MFFVFDVSRCVEDCFVDIVFVVGFVFCDKVEMLFVVVQLVVWYGYIDFQCDGFVGIGWNVEVVVICLIYFVDFYYCIIEFFKGQ